MLFHRVWMYSTLSIAAALALSAASPCRAAGTAMPTSASAALTRVLNGEARAPRLTLGSIGELRPERLKELVP